MKREPEQLPLWETVSVVQGTTGISTPAVGGGWYSKSQERELGVDLCPGEQQLIYCLPKEGLDWKVELN
jgi:hypothetical protein